MAWVCRRSWTRIRRKPAAFTSALKAARDIVGIDRRAVARADDQIVIVPGAACKRRSAVLCDVLSAGEGFVREPDGSRRCFVLARCWIRSRPAPALSSCPRDRLHDVGGPPVPVDIGQRSPKASPRRIPRQAAGARVARDHPGRCPAVPARCQDGRFMATCRNVAASPRSRHRVSSWPAPAASLRARVHIDDAPSTANAMACDRRRYQPRMNQAPCRHLPIRETACESCLR